MRVCTLHETAAHCVTGPPNQTYVSRKTTSFQRTPARFARRIFPPRGSCVSLLRSCDLRYNHSVRQVLRALRLAPSLWKLSVVVRRWLQGRGKPGAVSAERLPTRHVWQSYASWQAGEMVARKLRVPECSLCGDEMTNENIEAVCRWFGANN